MTLKLNGSMLYEMLISAANSLDNSKDVINNMNVFPVPDGDTGINMTMTMRTLRTLNHDGMLSECAKQASELALRAARGNSGAILSLFFRGMSKAFRGLNEAGIEEIAVAFRRGYDEAYKAVMNPTKGTILTVMKKCAEGGEKFVEASSAEGAKRDVESLFESMLTAAEIALAKTPEQLPKLKEARVVDAGGYGFVVILKGMVAALHQQPVALLSDSAEEAAAADFGDFDTEEITFAYCTECIVDKAEPFAGKEDAAEALHAFVGEIGDSVVFIEDETIIKLHVHTDHPGNVLEKALEYGSLAMSKIENMKIQHSHKVAEKEQTQQPNEIAKIEKKFGFVAVCLGDGIADAFRDVGVDQVIRGGQTMNPSTQDIIDAVHRTPAEYVFVLPNNKNIYMVAEQAAGLVRDRTVIVIPTRSVPQGISAMIAFNPDATAEQNAQDMEEAISHVTSLSVTGAIRDTTVQGMQISDGQLLGLVDGSISCVADTAEECLRKLTAQMTDASYILVFLGDELAEADPEPIEQLIRAQAPQADVAVMMGGQPLYPYIISVE